jgi:hypothetical protein
VHPRQNMSLLVEGHASVGLSVIGSAKVEVPVMSAYLYRPRGRLSATRILRYRSGCTSGSAQDGHRLGRSRGPSRTRHPKGLPSGEGQRENQMLSLRRKRHSRNSRGPEFYSSSDCRAPSTASGSAITISSKPCATAKLSDLAAVHASRRAH